MSIPYKKQWPPPFLIYFLLCTVIWVSQANLYLSLWPVFSSLPWAWLHCSTILSILTFHTSPFPVNHHNSRALCFRHWSFILGFWRTLSSFLFMLRTEPYSLPTIHILVPKPTGPGDSPFKSELAPCCHLLAIDTNEPVSYSKKILPIVVSLTSVAYYPLWDMTFNYITKICLTIFLLRCI